jgi:hypothetical protein
MMGTTEDGAGFCPDCFAGFGAYHEPECPRYLTPEIERKAREIAKRRGCDMTVFHLCWSPKTCVCVKEAKMTDTSKSTESLSLDDLYRLSQCFNMAGDLRHPQDRRINEWLHEQIDRKLPKQP